MKKNKIYESPLELIGNTPMVRLKKLPGEEVAAGIFAKLEYFNPAGSVKDRVALSMIEEAEREGRLKAGGVIIEPTSGNTGIGLAAVGAARGYRVIIVMPDTMSVERRKMMKAYGAELVLTPGAEGMSGAIKRAEELVKETEGSILAGQFDNPANPRIHLETTGPEIWETMEGKVDIFVSGVGTGGTLSGAGRFLKSQNPDIKVIAVEPANSPVLSKGEKGRHGIQGIGAGFVPGNLDRNIYDEIITVEDEAALETGREMGIREGILVGISSGAALWAAMEIGKRPENRGKNIVVICPDGGDRYLSTALYAE